MVDIDDNVNKTCPIVTLITNENKPKDRQVVYRVSWTINGSLKEEFYASKAWAERQRERLLESALILSTTVDVLIREVEVKHD